MPEIKGNKTLKICLAKIPYFLASGGQRLKSSAPQRLNASEGQILFIFYGNYEMQRHNLDNI